MNAKGPLPFQQVKRRIDQATMNGATKYIMQSLTSTVDVHERQNLASFRSRGVCLAMFITPVASQAR